VKGLARALSEEINSGCQGNGLQIPVKPPAYSGMMPPAIPV
jgi:hypothetical protein